MKNNDLSMQKRAEEVFKMAPDAINKLSNKDILKLVEDLHIHQTELEIQNENLRKARTELEDARDRYLDLYDFAPVSYFTVSDNGIIRRANLTAAATLGIERKSLIGKPLNEFINRDDQEIYYRHHRKLVDTKHKQTSELRFVKKDGAQFYAQMESNPALDKNGNIDRIRIAVTDITDRERMEQALRESEERYRTFSDLSPDGVVILDPNTAKAMEFNDQVCRQLGYSREEFAQLRISDIEAVESAEETHVHIQKVLSRGYDEFETLHRTKQGEIRHVRVFARLIEFNNRPVYHCIWRDITDNKQAEIKLREREENYRNLFENAGVGMFRTRMDGSGLLDMNQKFLDIFGRTREEMLGTPSHIFWADPAERQQLIRRLEAEGSITNFECKILKKRGQTRQCLASFKIFREQGIVEGTLLDITELRKLRAQLLQAQKMEAVGRLAGGIAHDFNNLLTIITGYAGFALDHLEKDTPPYVDIKEILEAGKRAASLTRRLLAFSRRQVIQPEILNLNDILKGTEKMLRRFIREDIELIPAFSSELWNTEVDPGQMEQVVLNLAVNARDAMPHGGKLIIETSNIYLDENYFRCHVVESKPGPYVMLSVTDNGTGMDEETCSRIFEPFYTTKDESKGTGIGLSMVYGIVKQNKGFIWVYSEPGKGTSFKIYLPAVKKAEVSVDHREKIPETELQGTETILLVEDDEKLLKMAHHILAKYKYHVLSTSKGEEALKISDGYKGTIHLLLTDVIMPKMTGKELAAQMASRRPGIRILYMSGYAEHFIANQGILDKNINFIQKPFLPDDLVRKARKVLED